MAPSSFLSEFLRLQTRLDALMLMSDDVIDVGTDPVRHSAGL